MWVIRLFEAEPQASVHSNQQVPMLFFLLVARFALGLVNITTHPNLNLFERLDVLPGARVDDSGAVSERRIACARTKQECAHGEHTHVLCLGWLREA